MREYESAAAKLPSPSRAPVTWDVVNYFAVLIRSIDSVNRYNSKGSDSGQGPRSFERSKQNATIGKNFHVPFRHLLVHLHQITGAPAMCCNDLCPLFGQGGGNQFCQSDRAEGNMILCGLCTIVNRTVKTRITQKCVKSSFHVKYGGPEL